MPELARYVLDSLGTYDGRHMYAVGDVSGDDLADLVLQRRRRDLNVPNRFPTDLVLFLGKPGTYPNTDDGIRIGPTEQEAEVSFVAAGDWDRDGFVDLCTHIVVYSSDTTLSWAESNLGHIVVWWGKPHGEFTLEDTTRIGTGVDGWGRPNWGGFAHDYDRDGVVDLMVIEPIPILDGEFQLDELNVRVWFGNQGNRWGRELSRSHAWDWWEGEFDRFDFRRSNVQWIDQDSDGYLDLVRYEDGRAGEAGSILINYGLAEGMIDTSNAVLVSLDSASGKKALFADITGDKVPELLVNTGGQEVMKVFVGFKGQRIEEQYGLGNEPGQPGEEIWWGKPWAVLPLVGKLHDGWDFAGWSPIYDLGDGGLDGVGDLWVSSTPDIICYNGGNRFDSLYDGWITVPGGIGTDHIPMLVGDMTGTGVQTIAVWLSSPRGVMLTQPRADLPTGGRVRPMVPGTEQPPMSVEAAGSTLSPSAVLGLSIEPNPSNGVVRIRWRPEGGAMTLRITDNLGQEVLVKQIDAALGEFVWTATRTFGGRYWVSLSLDDDRSETAPVDIAR